MTASVMPVLVTTSYKGVFFGYLEMGSDSMADVMRTGVCCLKSSRICLFWSKAVGGVFGLSSAGPNPDCRIGAKVPELWLNGVTSVAICSDSSVLAWESIPDQGQI